MSVRPARLVACRHSVQGDADGGGSEGVAQLPDPLLDIRGQDGTELELPHIDFVLLTKPRAAAGPAEALTSAILASGAPLKAPAGLE